MAGSLLSLARWLIQPRFSRLDLAFLLAFLVVQLRTGSFWVALPVLVVGAMASGLATKTVRRIERRRRPGNG